MPVRLPVLLRVAALLGLAAACADGTAGAPAPAAPRIQPWALPASEAPAAQPSVSTGPDGRVHVSWIERAGPGAYRLRMASADHGRFDAARTIAEGRGWFVNWADFPSLLALPNGDLVSYVLVKTAPMPYAYDLRLTRSTDGGRHWSAPAAVHDDGTHGEHGFASLWAAGGDAVGVAWLDGRNTAAARGEAASGHGAHGGAMSLRAARLGREGKHEDQALDESTCDCCQTDAALTSEGPVLVYRDRTAGEVRDIAIVRQRDGRWDAPSLVHADGWFMPACPVNGPAVAALGREVHVAWYTAADGRMRVQLARSQDAGTDFAAPRVVASGPGVLGRVDVARLGDAVLVSWIEDGGAAGQLLRLAVYDAELAAEPAVTTVARLSARGHASGFPRMSVGAGAAWIVWTDVTDGAPRVRGARLDWPGGADAAQAGVEASSRATR